MPDDIGAEQVPTEALNAATDHIMLMSYQPLPRGVAADYALMALQAAMPILAAASAPAATVSPSQIRAAATGGGPCRTCRKPFYTHVCLSCSSDYQTPGPGCENCRQTGMDQTPCLPPAASDTKEVRPRA